MKYHWPSLGDQGSTGGRVLLLLACAAAFVLGMPPRASAGPVCFAGNSCEVIGTGYFGYCGTGEPAACYCYAANGVWGYGSEWGCQATHAPDGGQ